MSTHNPSILFLDDEENVLNGLKRHIHRKCPHWSCFFQTDPEQAIEFIKMQTIDLVVCDYRMPVMNGVDTLVAMREILPSLPAIMLTGSEEVATAVDAINKAQVAKFFTKPVAFESLMQGIQVVLNASHERANQSLQPFRQALDIMAPAVIMVDEAAKLIHANKSAARHFEHGQGLRIDSGSLVRSASVRDSQRLYDCLKDIAKSGDIEKRVLKLSSVDGAADFHAVLVSLPQNGSLPNYVMIVLHLGTDTTYDFTHEMMKELFGLTPSEARLVLALSSGEKLEEAAGTVGITVSSARTYMKRIFEKTGVNRQADLIKIIASSPVHFVSPNEVV